MTDLETAIQIQIELALGFEWGNPNSKIQQTERNKETWEGMARRAKVAEERGWLIEIPNELPDISDFPLDDLYVEPEA
jgi:hypothetical protein